MRRDKRNKMYLLSKKHTLKGEAQPKLTLMQFAADDRVVQLVTEQQRNGRAAGFSVEPIAYENVKNCYLVQIRFSNTFTLLYPAVTVHFCEDLAEATAFCEALQQVIAKPFQCRVKKFISTEILTIQKLSRLAYKGAFYYA